MPLKDQAIPAEFGQQFMINKPRLIDGDMPAGYKVTFTEPPAEPEANPESPEFWRNAPKGATHYTPPKENSGWTAGEFWKIVDGIAVESWIFLSQGLMHSLKDEKDGGLTGFDLHYAIPRPVEPASAIDDEGIKMQLVGQSGELAAEVYAAIDLDALRKRAPASATHYLEKNEQFRWHACWYKKGDQGEWLCANEEACKHGAQAAWLIDGWNVEVFEPLLIKL
jgi:hypothetical protein